MPNVLDQGHKKRWAQKWCFMDENKELSKRLKALRTWYGFSNKKDAASAIGIKFGTYQRYEYGGYPSRKNIDKIVSFYGCSKTWLLTGEGSVSPPGKILRVPEHDDSELKKDPEIQRLSITFLAGVLEEYLQGKPGEPFWEVVFWILNEDNDRGYPYEIDKKDYDKIIKALRSFSEKYPLLGIEFRFIDIVNLMSWVEKIIAKKG